MFPILHRVHVRLPIQRHSAPSLIFPQRIPPGSDGRHGQFPIQVLRFDADDSPRSSVSILLRRRLLPHGGVFLLDLFPRIQNEIEVFGDRERLVGRRFQQLADEVPRQHRQLLFVTGFVFGAEAAFVVFGDGQDVESGVGEVVGQEEMFAEGCISRL